MDDGTLFTQAFLRRGIPAITREGAKGKGAVRKVGETDRIDGSQIRNELNRIHCGSSTERAAPTPSVAMAEANIDDAKRAAAAGRDVRKSGPNDSDETGRSAVEAATSVDSTTAVEPTTTRQHSAFDDDMAEWQFDMMEAEMGETQGGMWEGHPQEIEALLSQVEAEAHAEEEEARASEAARERRPLWLDQPSSHKQEKGKNIRIRLLKERRRIASLYGGMNARGNGSHTFQLYVARARQRFGRGEPSQNENEAREANVEDIKASEGESEFQVGKALRSSWAQVQRLDPSLHSIFKKISQDADRSGYRVAKDGVLERSVHLPEPLGQSWVPVVPEGEACAHTSWKRWVFLQSHVGIFGAHRSAEKTLIIMKRQVFWQSMIKDVERWIDKCMTCIRFRKIPRKQEAVPVVPSGAECWEEILIDLEGPSALVTFTWAMVEVFSSAEKTEKLVGVCIFLLGRSKKDVSAV